MHDNAAALGADTSRITLFGESAGAFSVCWHLVSPISNALFARAILESGNCDSPLTWAPRAHTDAFSLNYAASIGCAGTSVVQCLRQLDTDAVFGGDLYGPYALMAPLMPWSVAIDGCVAAAARCRCE